MKEQILYDFAKDLSAIKNLSFFIVLFLISLFLLIRLYKNGYRETIYQKLVLFAVFSFTLISLIFVTYGIIGIPVYLSECKEYKIKLNNNEYLISEGKIRNYKKEEKNGKIIISFKIGNETFQSSNIDENYYVFNVLNKEETLSVSILKIYYYKNLGINKIVRIEKGKRHF